MAWPPLLSWILSSSSSSSSSSTEYESDANNEIEGLEVNDHHDGPNHNVQQAQNDQIEDHDDEDDNDVSYEPEEEEKEEEDDQNSNSTSDYTFTTYEPRPKRRRIDHTNEALTSVEEEKKRRGKRVWSKEDELELLRGFLEYYGTRQIRPTGKETASFYGEVKPKLKLECNKKIMVDKLGRLKRKYHNVVKKMNDMNSAGKEFRFKNPHENVIFELSDKIWSSNSARNDQQLCNIVQESHVVDSHEEYVTNNKYLNSCNNDNVGSSSVAADHHLRPQMRKNWSHSRLTTYDENGQKPDHHGMNDNGTASSLNNNDNNVDDNMNSNDIPGLIIGLAMNPIPLSLSNFGNGIHEVVDEKWRKQQILELEAYSKRLDLVQHQVKAALEDLRSKGAD